MTGSCDESALEWLLVDAGSTLEFLWHCLFYVILLEDGGGYKD